MSSVARAPGRVNLIGDHTDYTGGLVMPMAIDRDTTIEFTPHTSVALLSDDFDGEVRFDLPIAAPATVQPDWGRYVAGVAAAMAERSMPTTGFAGRVSTSVPIGGGLSSSAALEVAAALAFGIDADSTTIAEVCRRAEHLATNVPCGIMDQLTCVAGLRDHALLIDCHTLGVQPVRIPDDLAVWVVEVSTRTLDGSEYPTRVAQCEAAQREIGPLRTADVVSVEAIADPLLRARARHVVSENQRVRDFAAALLRGDARAAGQLMYESHHSLSQDFETSTRQMDDAVAYHARLSGVHGVRMTGGGFGGCIVLLTDADAIIDGMRVRAADGACLIAPLS